MNGNSGATMSWKKWLMPCANDTNPMIVASRRMSEGRAFTAAPSRSDSPPRASRPAAPGAARGRKAGASPPRPARPGANPLREPAVSPAAEGLPPVARVVGEPLAQVAGFEGALRFTDAGETVLLDEHVRRHEREAAHRVPRSRVDERARGAGGGPAQCRGLR